MPDKLPAVLQAIAALVNALANTLRDFFLYRAGWRAGRNEGSTAARITQQQQVLDDITTARHAADDVGALPDATVAERLRRDWTHPDRRTTADE